MAIAALADLHSDRAKFITSIPILAQSISSRNLDIRKASVLTLTNFGLYAGDLLEMPYTTI